MKQIYYVIQTLLRGRGSNIIKVISLGLGLTMSILLFSRVAYEQSFDTCFKDYDNLYQVWSIFSVKGEKFEPQEWNCGPVAGAILENFPQEVESAVSLSTSMVSAPLYNGLPCGYFGEFPQRGGVGSKFEHVYGICSSLQWKRAS